MSSKTCKLTSSYIYVKNTSLSVSNHINKTSMNPLLQDTFMRFPVWSFVFFITYYSWMIFDHVCIFLMVIYCIYIFELYTPFFSLNIFFGNICVFISNISLSSNQTSFPFFSWLVWLITVVTFHFYQWWKDLFCRSRIKDFRIF